MRAVGTGAWRGLPSGRFVKLIILFLILIDPSQKSASARSRTRRACAAGTQAPWALATPCASAIFSGKIDTTGREWGFKLSNSRIGCPSFMKKQRPMSVNYSLHYEIQANS